MISYVPSMPGFLFGSVVNVCPDLGDILFTCLPQFRLLIPHLLFLLCLAILCRSKIVACLLKYLDMYRQRSCNVPWKFE